MPFVSAPTSIIPVGLGLAMTKATLLKQPVSLSIREGAEELLPWGKEREGMNRCTLCACATPARKDVLPD